MTISDHSLSNQQSEVMQQERAAIDIDQVSAWLRLTNTPGVGIQTTLRLLAAFGLPTQIFAQSCSALTQCVSETIAQALLAEPTPIVLDQIAHTLNWLRQPGHYLLTLSEPNYPKRLLELSDPPPLLYVQGQPDILNSPSLAIVGARHATTQGMRDAGAFAQTLADKGITVISGLATGIDAAAHRGVLCANKKYAVAVMGTGIDRIYPSEHNQLAQEIAEHGALVSELPLGAPPAKHHFPRRNRIIAGLSLGVIVIEAAAQSGSLITARIASEIGREVFALPGSIHAPLSKGCHALIKQGAKLTESVDDIFGELAFSAYDFSKLPTKTEQQTMPIMTESKIKAGKIDSSWLKISEQNDDLFMLFAQKKGYAPFSFDEVCGALQIDVAKITTLLLELELAGQIEVLPGGRYRCVQ